VRESEAGASCAPHRGCRPQKTDPEFLASPILDLAVVGGGPAGLAVAIEARLAGLSVAVFDRALGPGIDKACGEGLMPDAVARLASLGVRLSPAESFPFRGIRYVDGGTIAEGTFPQASGLGVRRPVLHRALAERAAELGARLLWGTAVTGLAPEGLATTTGPVAARWIAGADGLASRVREWAGLATAGNPRAEATNALPGLPSRSAVRPDIRSAAGAPDRRRFGLRRHFCLAPWADLVEVHWGPGCEAYVTPVASDLVGVAILWSGEARGGFDDLLARFPALAARLAGAPAASRDRGSGPLRQRVRGVVAGRVALVGDASGYFDAITGEGLAVALHQAAALARVLTAGDLSAYEAAHRRIGRLPDFMTGLMLAIERRPRLRRRAIAALAAEPALFSRLLGIHARSLPPRRLGLDGAVRLAWRLLAA
jgi:flavin-dependent dehydrogenase